MHPEGSGGARAITSVQTEGRMGVSRGGERVVGTWCLMGTVSVLQDEENGRGMVVTAQRCERLNAPPRHTHQRCGWHMSVRHNLPQL